ncbi:MAG TPA: hypothetical protein ENI98_13535 [Gammaproteobacteria bacterium]|nr:hypothetical protein [Gammaproteobacteria bacterium]
MPALKNLQRFLSRAEKKSVAIHNWHSGLASLFLLEKLSVAELRYRQFAGTTEKDIFYLCADPVYIQPDLTSAVLLAHEELDLSLDGACELAAAINAHFLDESWSLEVLTPHRWVLKLPQQPAMTTTPLMQLRQQPIGDKLPQGQDSRYWQRIQNEIQMLLFAHPLNQQRETQGKRPVNSLWFWGEGVLPEQSRCDWQSVVGQGELLDALTDWSGCDRRTMSIRDKLVIDGLSNRKLLASDEFVSAIQQHDLYAWIKALEQLEHNWICVLLSLLGAGKLDSVVLLAGKGQQFSLNRKMLKRWWRRMKPITEIF